MTRFPRSFSLLVCLTILVAPLGAQSTPTQSAPAPPVSDAQSISALNKSLSTLIGVAGVAPASLVATGTYTRFPGATNQGSADPIRIETSGPASFRSDLTTSAGTVTNIIVGTSGWTQSASGGRALAVGETFGRGLEMLPVLLISRWLNTSGVAANYVAAETLNGTAVQHITITPPNAPPPASPDQTNFEQIARCEVYLNSTSNLPVRIRVYQHPTDRRKSIPLDLDFSNYQSSSGTQFPQSIAFSIAGDAVGLLQIQSVALNVAVSASDFTWSEQ